MISLKRQGDDYNVNDKIITDRLVWKKIGVKIKVYQCQILASYSYRVLPIKDRMFGRGRYCSDGVDKIKVLTSAYVSHMLVVDLKNEDNLSNKYLVR